MDPKVILIVDDEQEVISSIVKRMFFKYRNLYEPLICIDGYEALEFIRGKKNISVIVLDLSMPNLDGVEVCRQIFLDEELKKIPVIVSSGFVNEDAKSELEKLGVKHFLRKPYSIDSLFSKVEEVIKR